MPSYITVLEVRYSLFIYRAIYIARFLERLSHSVKLVAAHVSLLLQSDLEI